MNATLSESRSQLTSREKPQTYTDVLPQMYSQNVSIPPDYFAWRSALSSQPDSRCNWTESDTDVGEQQTNLLSSKSSTHSGHLSKSDISGPYPQSKNLVEMNTQQTSNTRPLPPVPQTHH